MSLLRWHKGSERLRAKSSPYRLMQSRSGLTGTLGVNRRNDSLRRLQSSVAHGGGGSQGRIGDKHDERCPTLHGGLAWSRALWGSCSKAAIPAVSAPAQAVNPHDEAARLIKTLDL